MTQRNINLDSALRLLEGVSGFLTDEQILACICLGSIYIEPFDWGNLNITDPNTWPEFLSKEMRPTAYVFHLGLQIKKLKKPGRTIKLEENVDEDRDIDVVNIENGYTLETGDCVWAYTREKIGLSNDILGLIDGLKSLAQKFLTIHTTSQIWNPGDGGPQDPKGSYQLTLEMRNDGPLNIVLRPGIPICKMLFYRLPRPTARHYWQVGTKAPRGI